MNSDHEPDCADHRVGKDVGEAGTACSFTEKINKGASPVPFRLRGLTVSRG